LTFAINRSHKVPSRYITLLAHENLHSDDERLADPDSSLGEVFIRAFMPWRSDKATYLVQEIDNRRIGNRRSSSSNSRRRIAFSRNESNSKDAPQSLFKPPSRLPIDVYDPDWYNSLSLAKKTNLHPQDPIFPIATSDILDVNSRFWGMTEKDIKEEIRDIILQDYEMPDEVIAVMKAVKKVKKRQIKKDVKRQKQAKNRKEDSTDSDGSGETLQSENISEDESGDRSVENFMVAASGDEDMDNEYIPVDNEKQDQEEEMYSDEEEEDEEMYSPDDLEVANSSDEDEEMSFDNQNRYDEEEESG
jgi:hypothetical protein